MCWPKPNVPDYGAQAQQEEDKRQSAIREGTATVNQNFEKFTPGYFGGIGDAYRRFYRPQVDDQAKDARRATTLQFANNPNSSAANRVAGNLQGDYNKAVANVGSGGIDATNQARSQVEGQRGNLLNLVNAGSGLENVAAQSANYASTFSPPVQYSPLGDLFSKYTDNFRMANQAQQGGYTNPNFYTRTLDALRGSPMGSSTVVRG